MMRRMQRSLVHLVLGSSIAAVLLMGPPVRAQEAPPPPPPEELRAGLPDGLTVSPDMRGVFYNYRLVSRVEGGEDPRMRIIDPRNFLSVRNLPAVPGTYGFYVNFDKARIETGTQLELSIASPTQDGGVVVAGGKYGYLTVGESDDFVADTIDLTNPEAASRYELYQRIIDKTHGKVVMVEPFRVDKP